MNDFRRLYDLPELADIYRRAKIVINKGHAHEINIRTFEATAAGALLVTDEGAAGLEDLFVPGREIVTYKDDDDAVRVIRELLNDAGRRQTIADAGRRACLSRHTWEHRANTVMDVASRTPERRLAPARGWSEAERLVRRASVLAHFPMIDALCTLIAESSAPRWAKVRAIGHLARGVATGVRRLGWRRFWAGRGARSPFRQPLDT
jgi:hypothetical protein